MKRTAFISILVLLSVFAAIFFQTAINPGDFAGQWYSSDDQKIYLFYEGLIYNAKHSVELSESWSISGAYSFCKDSIFLFAQGIDGLEIEKELYLVQMDDGSFLCENRDGSGKLYFSRYSN